MSTTGYGPGGDTAGSVIQSAGDQVIDVQGNNIASNLDIDAGVVDNSRAIIAMNAAGQDQTILVQNGNLTLDGGTALDTQALIESANTQNIGTAATSAIDGYVAVRGGSGDSADAIIRSEAEQSLLIAGNDRLMGGTPFTDAALGLYGGSEDVTDGGDAIITQTNGTARQTIDVTTGNLELIGGTGLDAVAAIRAAGDNEAVGEEAQRILVQSGDLIVRADQDAGGLNNTGSFAEILASNTDNASQLIDVDGDVEVSGGDDQGEYARVTAAGTAVGVLTQDMNAEGSMTVTGGVGADAYARVETLTTDAASNQQLVVQNTLTPMAAAGLTVQGAADSANTGNEAGIVSAATGSDAQV
ncbi:hypothetical protein J2T55_002679, partial [Methylohalomonas lacus]